MDFSVLISVYNNETAEHLDQCLRSLVDQTRLPDEIVLVKDGPLSSDLNILIRSYETLYEGLFRVVASEHNVGLADALHLGLAYCSYELVARMDSDDICVPHRFEKQIAVMETDPTITVLGSRIAEFDETGTIVSIRDVPLCSREILRTAKRRNPMNHMSVVFRKSAVLSAGSYTRSKDEDYHLWARMLMNECRLTNLADVLVYVRAGKDFLKRRGGIDYLRGELKLQWRFYKMGFTSLRDCILNILIRSCVRLSPIHVRSMIYSRLLRKAVGVPDTQWVRLYRNNHE